MDGEKLPLRNHLEELRWRSLRILIVFLITSSFSLFFVKTILEFLLLPWGRAVVYLSPTEALFAYLRLTVLSGLILTFPYFLWESWGFVSKGLLPHEKKYFLIYFPFSLGAFCLGVLLAFRIILPLFLQLILRIGSDSLQPMISVGQYLSFVATLLLSFGVLFEFPVAVLFLSHVGLLTPSFLIEKWRHILVLAFILGAVLSPPDVLSQIVIAIPFLFLYGVSILFSHLGIRLREKSRPLPKDLIS